MSIFALLAGLTGCTSVKPTVHDNPALPFVELGGYKFHVRTFGNPQNPPLIVVHGGPGGDSKYLYPLEPLSKDHFLIFYDQRGTGLSPRVDKAQLTLDSSLDDLHQLVLHYGQNGPVKLVGHSWGGMLVMGYLGQHPERVSHAVVVEPGMLTTLAAQEFVLRLKASQSWRDALPIVKYIVQSLFVSNADGHGRFDYVMTRLMNQSKPGGPYQCEGQAMPPDAFERAGYEAFSSMLTPVFDNPARFTDLTGGANRFKGPLMLLSSECSFIGYSFQQQFHMPVMPRQTRHVQAPAMGHNMLTLNPDWSVALIRNFFGEKP
jgi:proline iminopeptidase